jgi:diguanylate cyclase (GGDEF)-like protein
VAAGERERTQVGAVAPDTLQWRPDAADAANERDRATVRRVRNSVYGLLGLLVGLALVALSRSPRDPLTVLEIGVVLALITALWTQRELGRRISARRAARDAGLTRMLQGMSRSVSSDSIVQAIVDELRGAADADHILVARLRPVDRVVETTLVSNRARVPPSRMLLPAGILDVNHIPLARRSALENVDEGDRDAQLVADEIARRLAESYALPNTLAMPLVSADSVLGALILSRRQRRIWSVADRRLLAWASAELSAALARAFAFEEAENQANIDVLTGLPNRRYLEELLATVGPRRRSVDRLGALMIDLDHFKRLNDKYGHRTGDRVLRAVGERISQAVRAEDTPARYGGEEFAVVLRRATKDQAVEIAERIRSQIADIAPDELGIRDRITVSIGVAVADIRAGEVAILLEAADAALYSAKRQGRNRVVLAA